MAALIIGVIIVVAGYASDLYGNDLNASFWDQARSVLSGNGTNPGDYYKEIGQAAMVIGAILVIFGIVFMIVKALDKDSNQNSETKNYCPNCGSELLDDASFCQHCGHHLNLDKHILLCCKCGKEIPQGTKFCHYCGQIIDLHKGEYI